VRGTFVILRRELGSLFFAPLAWILLAVSLLLNGYLFASVLGATRGDVTASLEFAFGGNLLFWGLIVVLAPLVTMRLVTEEASSGTLEYLRTAPVGDAAVVAGKFLAGTTFMAVLWLSGPVYAAAIHAQGVVPDWGQVVAIYLGAVLASALFLALGMMAGATTATPLLGAFLAFSACLSWLLLPWLGQELLGQIGPLLARLPGGAERAQDVLLGMLDRTAVIAHFQRSYFRGVLDSAEVAFFLTWTLFFLFLTTRVLEAKRWRG